MSSVSFNIPDELAMRYERLAKATGKTKTFYMIEALASSIERLECEYGVTIGHSAPPKVETYEPNEVSLNAIVETDAAIASGAYDLVDSATDLLAAADVQI